jgi:1-acyl-sn-glycerol-3-phosphate acyltransferase
MRWLAGSELRAVPMGAASRLAMLGNALRLHAALLVFSLLCLLTSTFLVVAGWFMRREQRQLFARAAISRMFRLQLHIVQAAGVMRLDLSELDALHGQPAMVIAPNHPSMIDAALVLSRLPDLTCVMKAQILANPLFGAGARSAGYITHEPARSMLRAAVENLNAGHHLLLFPEGTRTQQLPVNPLQRTVGVIAKRANAQVQSIHIEAGTAFLCKGWPMLRVPATPMVYRVRLGRRFDPPADVDAFTAELEAYFRTELAGARLPALPVDRHSR